MGNISIGGSFIQKACFGNGLKSTQEKQKRQDEMEHKVAFFEQQKENLKHMECDTIEEIQRKLEMFHSYEDQIKATKSEYNNQQAMHVMDEAMEQGEKIAEAVEKNKPKTEEERREEMLEEAAGTESGALSEMLEDLPETEELEDAAELEQLETLEEAGSEKTAELSEQPEIPQSEVQETMEQAEVQELAEQQKLSDMQALKEQAEAEYMQNNYLHIDTRI